MNLHLTERELTSALAAVTDAIEKTEERLLRCHPPRDFIKDHFHTLLHIREKLSHAYEATDL